MSRDGWSFRFTHAVVRRPGQSVVRGLRTVDCGSPDFALFQDEHEAYIQALERAGLKVTVLDALEAFPDSVFVEDTALCLPEGTVILRPGAPSRTGEAEWIAGALEDMGHRIHHLEPGGFVDGGDVLVCDSTILVGLSGRTDRAGYEALKSVLEGWGYAVRAVHTPGQVLHLKSDCCMLDGGTILATARLAGAECLDTFEVLNVPPGEEAAANSIRVNDSVLIPAGFPATAELLGRQGFRLEALEVSQARLLDGGLSCMSLRF